MPQRRHGALVAAVDPHPLPLAQVAGGGLDGPLLVELEHLPRRGAPAGAGPATSPTGVRGCDAGDEAELGHVHVADAGEAASGRAAPRRSGRAGSLAQPASASSSSQSGPSRSGPRWPTEVVLAVAGDELDDAEREADRRRGRRCSSTTRAWWAGRRHRWPPGVDPPGALHLEVGVQRPRRAVGPPSIRVSRCLPRETVSAHGGAGQVGGGELRHPEVGAGQHLPGQRAVEQPGGAVDGVALRHGAAVPSGCRDEAGGGQRLAQRRRPAAEQLLAVGLLDGQPAQRRRGGRPRPATAAAGVSRSGSSDQVSSVRPPRSTYRVSAPSTSTTSAPALRPGPVAAAPSVAALGRRSGQGSAAPYGLAGSVAASATAAGLASGGRARRRCAAGRSRRRCRTGRRRGRRRSSRAGSARSPRRRRAPCRPRRTRRAPARSSPRRG